MFSDRGLLNETLFVIMGDHGTALYEHGTIGGLDNAKEQLFNIPMILYSENSEWKRNYGSRKSSKKGYSLDILPTILHALANNKYDEDSVSKFYEGESVFFKEKETKKETNSFFAYTRVQEGYNDLRIFFGISSPAGHSLHVLEGNRKFVAYRNGKEEFYDLKKDPNEDNPIEVYYLNDTTTLDKSSSLWVQKARQALELFRYKVYDSYLSSR